MDKLLAWFNISLLRINKKNLMFQSSYFNERLLSIIHYETVNYFTLITDYLLLIKNFAEAQSKV